MDTPVAAPAPSAPPDAPLIITLVEKITIGPNSYRFVFALPTPESQLPTAEVGQHCFLQSLATSEGLPMVMRSYTPTSPPEQRGTVDFVIKIYRPCEAFPKGGAMSARLDALEVGRDTLVLKLSPQRLQYAGKGLFLVGPAKSPTPPTPFQAKHVVMIAGGTGITPMIQLIRTVLREVDRCHEEDGGAAMSRLLSLDASGASSTQQEEEVSSPALVVTQHLPHLTLIYSNHSEEDILLSDELFAWQCRYGMNLRVHHTLTQRAPEGWRQYTGRVTQDMLAELIFSPGPGVDAPRPRREDIWVAVCGPPRMISESVKPALAALEFTKEQIFVM